MDDDIADEEFVGFDRSEIKALAAQPHGGDALLMLAKLKLAHWDSGKPFIVTPSGRDRVLTWSVMRLRKALDTLRAAGLVRVAIAGKGRRPNLYEFTRGE